MTAEQTIDMVPDSPLVDEHVPSPGKVNIAIDLARVYGYKRYFEITTGTTGRDFARAHAAFDSCSRLVYRYAVYYEDDGLPIDFPIDGEETATELQDIRDRGLKFDVILVDPHHTYMCSLRDLQDAFSILKPGGALVVHDCDPPDKASAVPEFISYVWCGVTYKAFLDFVLADVSLEYFTVDCDYGCGVIFKRPPASSLQKFGRAVNRFLRPDPNGELIAQWQAIGDNYDAAFDFFQLHRSRLLKLISCSEFRTRIRRQRTPKCS